MGIWICGHGVWPGPNQLDFDECFMQNTIFERGYMGPGQDPHSSGLTKASQKIHIRDESYGLGRKPAQFVFDEGFMRNTISRPTQPPERNSHRPSEKKPPQNNFSTPPTLEKETAIIFQCLPTRIHGSRGDPPWKTPPNHSSLDTSQAISMASGTRPTPEAASQPQFS